MLAKNTFQIDFVIAHKIYREYGWGVLCEMFVQLPGCLGFYTSRALILLGRIEMTQIYFQNNYFEYYMQNQTALIVLDIFV